MTVLRSVTCSAWPIAIGSTTPCARSGPATLPPAHPRVDPERCVASAAAALGIDPARILGRERSAQVVLARQLAMVCAHRGGEHTLSEIGRVFGRSHTTVMYALRAIEERMHIDPAIAGLLDWIASAASAGPDASSCTPPRPARPARRARRAPAQRPARRPAVARVDEAMGSYGPRRVLLSAREGAPVLLDTRHDGADERVIERFAARSRREHIAAVARDYLEQARQHGGPVVRSAAA